MLTRILNIPKNQSFFLFGPRQTGKSTLIKSSFHASQVRLYDLLQVREYLRLLASPGIFREEVLSLPADIKFVVVDEIQRIPLLLDEIHSLIESGIPQKFVLTGSSARKLKRAQANMLAGRAWKLNLYPLTVAELGNNFHLKKSLEFGTLPGVYLNEDPESARETLRSYVETYLKEEIEAEALVRKSSVFLRFLSLAADENTRILNFSKIARDTGSTAPTVKEYYSILEDTMIGNMLFPFLNSKRKRLAHHPKFYFFDCGVQRALSKRLTVGLEASTYEYGKYFETFIINEVIRISSYYKKDFQLSYFRTESGVELDLIIETPSKKVIAVEIKSGTAPDLLGLTKAVKAFSQIVQNADFICVCDAPYPRVENNMKIMPWREFFNFLIEF